MIRIDLYQDDQKLLSGYRVLGHAAVNSAGVSVACAWVSAITQTALIGLEQRLQYPVAYELDETKGLLAVKLEQAPDERTEDLLRTMESALEQLAAACPQEVAIRKHRG